MADKDITRDGLNSHLAWRDSSTMQRDVEYQEFMARREDKIEEELNKNTEFKKLANVLAEPVRHAIEDSPWSTWYSQVIPDSGFWTSIDQMINYFTQVRELDRREILVHLENMKKRGIVILQGHLEEVKTKAYGENKEGYLTTDTVYESKWKWDGTNNDYPSKGILGQIEEARAKGDIKPYTPLSVEDLKDYLVKDENGNVKGHTIDEIKSSGVFGLSHGDKVYTSDMTSEINTKNYLAEKALNKFMENKFMQVKEPDKPVEGLYYPNTFKCEFCGAPVGGDRITVDSSWDKCYVCRDTSGLETE